VDEIGISLFREMNGFRFSKLAVLQDGQFREMVALWDGHFGENS
jgi:hypothetical protein